MSWIMFKQDFMDREDFAALHGEQLKVPYDPADRVSITRCAGNAWCNDDAQLDFMLRSEPETGVFVAANIHMMASVRIGTRPTLLHNFSDTLVPVYGLQAYPEASDKQEEQLADLQNMPSTFALYMWLAVGVGAVGLVVTSSVWIWVAWRQRRQNQLRK